MAKNKREIKTVKMGKEFSNCPACGYEKGFHNMFRKTVDNGHLKWFLICPKCGNIYDIGLTSTKR